jgi:hypothetical protein
MIGMRILK